MTTGYAAAFEPAMRAAIAEAVAAAVAGPQSADSPRTVADVPVGAVVLDPSGTIIARAGNRREADVDPTAHAEILAIRQAAVVLRSRRLAGCTLVVTLEPCTMCAGAVLAAQPERLVYGAADPKAGAAGSVWDLVHDRRLGPPVEVISGVLADACADLLEHFFGERR
jgi:tRNA(adenine34) deaminase